MTVSCVYFTRTALSSVLSFEDDLNVYLSYTIVTLQSSGPTLDTILIMTQR